MAISEAPELEDSLIVSLSRNFWDEVWRSRHQVMSRLATRNTVVFGSRPLLVPEVLPWSPARPAVRQPGVHSVHADLHAYVPPRHLPTVYRFPLVENVLEKRRQAHLRRLLRRWAPKPQILYLWHPSFEGYIDAMPGALVCYHLFDDLSAYVDAGGHRTADALARIIARAHVVFVASEELASRFRGIGNVHWIPNGVDYEAYASAGDLPCPEDLARVPRPRLGYAGTLRAQIDLPLLANIARRRPEWSVVLIGDVSRGTSRSDDFLGLQGLPNVHVLGQKALADMPAYLRNLDAGLLPYRLDGAARFCYPLKMHEYLAAGLPVVASSLPAARPFAHVIDFAGTAAEWTEAIARAMAATGPEAVAARRAVALQNSWDERVARISRLAASRQRDIIKTAHRKPA